MAASLGSKVSSFSESHALMVLVLAELGLLALLGRPTRGRRGGGEE